MISDFPLFGVSPGATSPGSPPSPTRAFGTRFGVGPTDHAHNEFLEALAELGVLGGLLYFWLLAWLVIRGFQGLRAARLEHDPQRFLWIGGYAGLLGELAHSMVSINLRSEVLMIVFWVLWELLPPPSRPPRPSRRPSATGDLPPRSARWPGSAYSAWPRPSSGRSPWTGRR